MTDTKFTHGKWEVNYDLATTSKDLNNVCAASYIIEFDMPVDLLVEHDSNAHLIAAAPEMYQMLKGIRQGLRIVGGFEKILPGIDELLAEARGES